MCPARPYCSEWLAFLAQFATSNRICHAKRFSPFAPNSDRGRDDFFLGAIGGDCKWDNHPTRCRQQPAQKPVGLV